MGRRKIEIQPLTDDRNRTVTFVKRKAGLFKKAHELAVLCQVDLAVIIIGNNNKLYEFSSVDTREILNVYNSGKTPHESKSPENYGNYKRKRYLTKHYNNNINDDDISLNEDNLDSESPEPKRQRTSGSIYSYNEVDGNASAPHQRPVLRVQIPTDAKGSSGNDSAKTITALDTSTNNNSSSNKSNANSKVSSSLNSSAKTTHLNVKTKDDANANNVPSINTPKYSSFNTFRGSDNKKPITQLPLPIQNKSQTSSPASATAPSLPVNGPMSSFFSSMPQHSPTNAYAPNNVLNNSNPNANNNANNSNNSVLPTPVLNQVFYQQYISHQNNENETPNPNGSTSQAGNNKFKPLHFNNNNNNGNSNQFQMKDDQTPVSGLPSRYVNDMFPSPSNFYAPQEWPTGMTPIHSNAPQYFMNMLPSGGPLSAIPGSAGGGGSQNNGSSSPSARSQQQSQQQQQLQQQQQQQQQLQQGGMASPLQYMGPFNTTLVNHPNQKDKNFK